MTSILKPMLIKDTYKGQKIERIFISAIKSGLKIYKTSKSSEDEVIYKQLSYAEKECKYLILNSDSKILKITDKYIKVKIGLIGRRMNDRDVSISRYDKADRYIVGYVPRNYNVFVRVSVTPKLSVKALKQAKTKEKFAYC